MAMYLIMISIIFGTKFFMERYMVTSLHTERNWLYFSVLVLSFVQGIRDYSIGTDTTAYVTAFLTQRLDNFEIGYQLFNKGIYMVTRNASIFLFIEALMINGMIIRAIDKISVNKPVSLFTYITLYYYFNSYNVARQYIAIAFVLTAYTYLRETKFVCSALFFLIAFTFHLSAVVSFPLGLISVYSNRERNQIQHDGYNRVKYVLIIVTLIISTQLIFGPVLEAFIRYFPRYNYYLLTGSDYSRGTNAIQQRIVYSLILIVYILFAEENKYAFIMTVAVSLSFLMTRLFAVVRFVYYYDIFSIFAIASIWNSKKFNQKSQIIVRTAILISCFSFMIYYLIVGYMRITPYKAVVSLL